MPSGRRRAENVISFLIRREMLLGMSDRFAPIVLKNSKIAALRKSLKGRMWAISAAARLCRIGTSVGGCFAAIDVVPHIAANEANQRS